MKLKPALLLIGSIIALQAPLVANKTSNIVQGRVDRIERSEIEVEERIEREERVWPDAKIAANLRRQVPVAEMLGYLAANYGVDDRLASVRKAVEPVLEARAQLANERQRYIGLDLSRNLRRDVQKLRAQTYGAIAQAYGEKTLRNLRTFLQEQDTAYGKEYFILGEADY